MNILRRSAIVILAALLSFSLLGLAWSHAAQTTIRDRDTVKGWLDESGFYDRVVDIVVDNTVENSQEDGLALPENDPELYSIANSAFTPDYLKQITEEVLDGTYGWLEGQTTGPEFSVDLSDIKARLVDGISSYATSRASELPACTTAESIEMAAAGEFDTWDASCLPAGLTPEQVGEETRAEILAAEGFLEDTEFTGEDFKVNTDSGQLPIGETDQSKRAQEAYQWTSYGPIVFAVISILSGLGVFFLSSDKRKGLRRIGGIFVVNSVLLGISYLVLSQGSKWSSTTAAFEGNAGQMLAADFFKAVSGDLGRILLIYTIALLAIGIACIVAAYLLGKGKKGNSKPNDTPSDTTDNPSSTPVDKPAEPAPQTNPPKPKTPRKIQL